MRASSELFQTLFRDGSTAGLTDEQLLARFLGPADDAAEQAFTALVQRHGPMVLRVCRDLLRNPHDAEDAAQATFLVLARKASSLQHRALLAPWLYGVARRTSAKTKARRRRAALTGQPSGALEEIAAVPDTRPNIIHQEEAEVLHEEIVRLPDRYRKPVTLCYLQGLTHAEAARQLGWPIGTVGVRLMRARERLHQRLSRRGMTPAGLLVAPSAALEPAFAAQTARAALGFCARRIPGTATVATPVATLAGQVLRQLAFRRLAFRLGTLLACGLLAAGSAALALPEPAKPPDPRPMITPPPAAESEPSPRSANSILVNGGIERADASGRGPEAWHTGAEIPGVEYLFDRTNVHDGRGSLRLKKTEPRYFPVAQWYQDVKRAGSAPRIKISAFVKAEKTAKATLDVAFETADGGGAGHEWVAYIGAQEGSDPPVTHDWKRYERVVAIPAGTQSLRIAAQIYGPGEVWFDDVVAEYTEAPATPLAGAEPAAGEDEIGHAGVPAEERTAGGDTRKRYFLMGPPANAPEPADGYKLLVVLPGGDGGPDFQPFVRNIAKNALPPGYLVAEPIAVVWTREQAEQIVWPTALDKISAAKFTTEEFINAVVADVSKTRKVDPRCIFALGWSSGGPPVYAAALRASTPIAGAFVAMSVFQEARYRNLKNARGRGFYILHSPQDFIPIATADAARKALRKAGAKAVLQSYEGGHGWHGDPFTEIRRGIEWLEANHGAPSKK